MKVVNEFKVEFELVKAEYESGAQVWVVHIKSGHNNLFGWQRGCEGEFSGIVRVRDLEGAYTVSQAFHEAVIKVKQKGDWRPILCHPGTII